MVEEQFFDPNRHDRQAFTSGVSELDDYLQRFAVQQSKKGVAVVRVLVDTDAPSTILGYYSLNAAQIDVAQLDQIYPEKITALSSTVLSHGTVGGAFCSPRSRTRADTGCLRRGAMP